MKIFRGVIAIMLLLAVTNVIVGKAFHELFEHEHVEHTCDIKDRTHYHDIELDHTDIICDFNFSNILFDDEVSSYDSLIRYYDQKVRILFLGLDKDLYYSEITLRGPPTIA